jgi:hypothetical protein
MVTVKDYAVREAKDGREFIALILQGGLSLLKSSKSGNYYPAVKSCSVPSTFDEETAKSFIGERLPGSVQRMSCDTYEWINKETGEVMELSHRWVYVLEGASINEAVYEGEPQVELADEKPRKFEMEPAFKKNAGKRGIRIGCSFLYVFNY